MTITTEQKLSSDRENYIVHGKILIPYGPQKGTGFLGWHLPGGGFTTSPSAALGVMIKINQHYGFLPN